MEILSGFSVKRRISSKGYTTSCSVNGHTKWENTMKSIRMLALTGVMTLMFCTIAGTGNACVNVNVANDTYTVDESGCVDY